MDDSSTLDPDFMMVLCAIVGILTAEDRQSSYAGRARISPHARLLLLVVLVGIASSYATSVRGFLYCLFMPIGAYKVAQVLTEPLWQRLAEWRAARRRAADTPAELG